MPPYTLPALHNGTVSMLPMSTLVTDAHCPQTHLQGREVSPMTTSPLPKSQSHANLRQGLDRVSSESSVSVEPDRAVLAASAAQSMMRRSKSKLSMDTLATVESMNCPIIEYSQLEIKRKIGDGSIGQVSCLLDKVGVERVQGL